jgi:two-component system, OmpR family, phosphate regulon sensor histidine kinase PhoR
MEQSLARLGKRMDLDVNGIVNLVVEEAIQLTGSKLGYFAVTDDALTTLTMIAWSKNAMAQCSVMEMPLIYPIEATGLWGDCIREHGAVITNDYDACTRPTKKGYPDGHVPVKRHLNVPVMDGHQIRGILGVGNKQDEYSGQDAQLLQAFANAAWPSILEARARTSR